LVVPVEAVLIVGRLIVLNIRAIIERRLLKSQKLMEKSTMELLQER
jgi:hypothetical protein